MTIKKNEIARCGSCRFYTPVGRRGGECSQLSVPVQSNWKACCLAKFPFKSSVAEMGGPDSSLADLSMESQVLLRALPVTPSALSSVSAAASDVMMKVSS